jgi:predicted nucleic acid-binding protein
MSVHDTPAQVSLLDGSSAKYCADANFFYEFWLPDRKFRKDIYDTLWTHMASQILGGTITSTEEVFRELKESNDPKFQQWLDSHKGYLYVEDDQAVITIATEILNKHPEILFQKGKKNGADAFLVATAKVYGLSVISEENREPEANLRNGACVKVPNLCDEQNVKCYSILDYCAKEGIKLGPTQ